MTRLAGYLLPTEKQAPTDAEAISHKLMVRAGLIRQVGSGLWTWLPAGWRVHRKISEIIRREMDAIGSHEMLMPVLQPADLWKKSGRIAISELFKLHDRKQAELVLAMTNEEVVTSHVAQVVRSYRDLPLLLYHIQTKERDEPRPRAGVLRTREFIMKDSYSFDRDPAGLDDSYAKHILAYQRIFDRSGLRWYRVDSDVGMMGGTGAHEYMAPCPAGENEVALAPGYAANVEVASADPQPVDLPDPLAAPEPVATPGLRTVAQVSGALDVAPGALLKAFPVIADDRGLVLVLVRGDHRVNEVKLTNALGQAWRPASEAEIADRIGPPGFIGPVGIDAPILLDDAVGPGGYVTGANLPDTHLIGVQPGRDFACDRADVRSVEPGDLVDGNPIRIEPAIEVGNIFKLGTRYSAPLGASYLDETGHDQLIWMGCYGIGPARIAAAAVEQFADGRGISWPREIAPFDVHLVAVGKSGTPERDLAETAYAALLAAGLDVLFDDREIGPGQKFADADLLGCPIRLTVGRRSLDSGLVEVVRRRGQEALDGLPVDGLGEAVRGLWLTAP
ncbi:MAG TPA: proline--tRNA ligase [Solirubrobacteraceae bacterium]|nr:proline--tRNA ligase [Solirubrobacteraceae bacterium]